MNTKNIKTTKMTTMIILSAALIGTLGIGALSAFADTIDFEGYTEGDQVGDDTTTLQTVTFSIEGGDDDCDSRDGSVVIAGNPRRGFAGTDPDAINGESVVNSLSNNLPDRDFADGWDSCDFVIDFAHHVSNLSLEFLDAGEPSGGTITLEVFSDHAQTTSVGSVSIAANSVASNVILDLDIPGPSAPILSARLSDGSGDAGSAIDNIEFTTALVKTSNCTDTDPEHNVAIDVLTKKHNFTVECSFTIEFNGPAVADSTIHDTVPAEWEVTSVDGSGCEFESSNADTPDNHGKKANRSATHIWCPSTSAPITVEVETRESPGKGHTKRGGDPAFKPTSCGVISLNDGAQLVDLDENVLATSAPLLLLVSEDGNDTNDCDGDTISDADEFANGTDPANRDTDGDGVDDNLDDCPLSGLEETGYVDGNGCPIPPPIT